MTDEDWESGFAKSVAVYLNGHGIPDLDVRGQRVIDDSFLLCFNAHHEPIEFTVPPKEFGTGVDAGDRHRGATAPDTRAGGGRADVQVEARAVIVLQAGD